MSTQIRRFLDHSDSLPHRRPRLAVQRKLVLATGESSLLPASNWDQESPMCAERMRYCWTPNRSMLKRDLLAPIDEQPTWPLWVEPLGSDGSQTTLKDAFHSTRGLASVVLDTQCGIFNDTFKYRINRMNTSCLLSTISHSNLIIFVLSKYYYYFHVLWKIHKINKSNEHIIIFNLHELMLTFIVKSFNKWVHWELESLQLIICCSWLQPTSILQRLWSRRSSLSEVRRCFVLSKNKLLRRLQ